jgi:hypothetical protein
MKNRILRENAYLPGALEQCIAALDLTSPNLGATLVGEVRYDGEGPIGFRGTSQR